MSAETPVLVCSLPSRRCAKSICSWMRERLVAEHEHGVLVHAGADALERLAVARGAQIDRADFGGEHGMQLAKCDRHADSPPGEAIV